MSPPGGSSRRSRLAAALPLVIVAVVPWLFLGPLWWGDPAARRYLPEGDFSSQYYPLRAYAAFRLAAGALPLWNPYVLSGQPGLADIQAATFYPVQSLQSLACGGDLSYAALELQVPIHLMLAAVGAYLLARRLTHSRWGGIAAGLAYGLGGYLTSFPVQQLTILCTAAWLPWLILAIERLADGRDPWRAAAALAVLSALVVLAGHPQTALLVAYFAAAYSVWRLWREPRRLWLLASAAGGAAIGVGLAAVQLLPTLEFIARSTRLSLGVEASSAGFGLHEVAGILYPGYFGGTPQYIGVVALVLALLGAVAVGWRRAGIWVAAAVAGLLLSFGSGTALYYLAYIALPGYGASRNQERAVMLPAFALAMLAAYGVAAFPGRFRCADRAATVSRCLWSATLAAIALTVVLQAGTLLPAPASGVNLFGGILKQHLWVVLGVAVPAVLLSLSRRRPLPDWSVRATLAVLIGANLVVVNYRYNLGDAPAAVTRPSAAAALLLAESLAPGERLASGGLLAEGPSAGMIYSLTDTSGNTPLQLASYSGFVEAVPEWRQWQLLAVSHVVLPAGASPAAGLLPVAVDSVGLYRIAEPVAPVRIVHQVVSPGGGGALAAIADPANDPSLVAVVEHLPAPIAPATGAESVSIVDWQEELVEVRVHASAAGLLVLAQVDYPGWQASIDGVAVDALTCDGLFIGVPVSEGEHDVRLEYRPTSVTAGAAVTLASILAVLALIFRTGVLPECSDSR